VAWARAGVGEAGAVGLVAGDDGRVPVPPLLAERLARHHAGHPDPVACARVELDLARHRVRRMDVRSALLAVLVVLCLSGMWALGAHQDLAEARAAEVDGWAWLHTDEGAPVVLDPCRPTSFVLNPTGAPAGAEAQLVEVLAEVSALTGRSLAYAGTTTEEPGTRPAHPATSGLAGLPPPPVLVAWAPEVPAGPEHPDALGVAAPSQGLNAHGSLVLTTAEVVIRSTDRDGRRPDDAALLGDRLRTVRHEVAHVVGLGHVDSRDEVMGRGRVQDFGTGDRAGLRAAGTVRCG
jgi:hypothetical protein